MNKINARRISTALLLSLLCAGSSFAQQDMGTELAKFGGAMHQTARFCEHYSQPELDRLKQGQKARHAEQGFDMNSFESSFAAGEAEVRTKWKGASETERTATCTELEAMLGAAGTGM